MSSFWYSLSPAKPSTMGVRDLTAKIRDAKMKLHRQREAIGYSTRLQRSEAGSSPNLQGFLKISQIRSSTLDLRIE